MVLIEILYFAIRFLYCSISEAVTIEFDSVSVYLFLYIYMHSNIFKIFKPLRNRIMSKMIRFN